MKCLRQAVRDDQIGTVVECHIRPGAGFGRIVGEQGGVLKVMVKERPVNGEANAALKRIFHKKLGIASDRIQIISGTTARRKGLFFAGVVPEQLEKLLEGALQ